MFFALILGGVIIVLILRKEKQRKEQAERDRLHNEWVKWSNTEEGKQELARRKLEADTNWSKGKPFSNERSIVTGDHYSMGGGDWSYSGTTYYCKYANSPNCMNCSRRKEIFLNDKYYYGESDNCYYFSHDYD